MLFSLGMAHRIRTLLDLIAHQCDLRIWCFSCGKSAQHDAACVILCFEKRGWPLDFASAHEHFRCGRCRSNAFLLLLPASRWKKLAPPKLGPKVYASWESGVAAWFSSQRAAAKREARIEAERPSSQRLRAALMHGMEARPARLTGFAAALARQRHLAMRAGWRVIERRTPREARLTAALAGLEARPMCNRYQLRDSHAEIAQLAVGLTPERLNYAGEVYPGYSGLVFANKTDGLKAEVMTWGFPLALKGKNGQPLKPRPVNNAREDKLHTWMWKDSFERRRCLIPASAWAEAEGEKGRMTCTWHTLGEDAPFMLGGIWRTTDEWGDAYSMVMVDGCAQMAEIHDRMPVVLRPEHWRRWVDGTPADAFALCQVWEGQLAIDRTDALWAAKT